MFAFRCLMIVVLVPFACGGFALCVAARGAFRDADPVCGYVAAILGGWALLLSLGCLVLAAVPHMLW